MGPYGRSLSEQEKKSYSEYKVIAEHPFEPQTRYSSVIVQHDSTNELIIRGNIQEVLKLMHAISRKKTYKKLPIGACKKAKRGIEFWPSQKKIFLQTLPLAKKLRTNSEFIGLISYEDPLKPTASASLERARKFGITVKVISGDTVEVNTAVAQTIKLISKPDEIISGEEFAKKMTLEKMKLVEQCAVFAHIVPDQKVEISATFRK